MSEQQQPESTASDVDDDDTSRSTRERVSALTEKPWLLTLLAGLLFMLSQPPFDLGPLALIAFVPWLLALPRFKTGWGVFFSAFAIGWAYYAVGLWWLAIMEGGAGGQTTIKMIWFVTTAIMGLYFPTFALGARWMMARMPRAWVVLVPLLWTGLEVWKYDVPAPGPLLHVGYAMHQLDAFTQIADVGAVHAVSLFVALIGAGVAARLEGWLIEEKSLKVTASLVLIVVLLVNTTYGSYRLLTIGQEIKNDGPHLALIQANISQRDKNTADSSNQRFAIHEVAAIDAAKHNVDLIVWSETSYPWTVPADFKDAGTHYLADVVQRDIQTPMVVGALTKPGEDTFRRYDWMTETDKEKSRLNTAWYLDEKGNVLGRHDKSHLVPGGEYLPMRGTLIGDLVAEFAINTMGYVPALTPGWRRDTHRLKTAEGDFRFSMNICYEFAFPQLYDQQHEEQNVHFMLNLSNEAWFFDSWELDQALIMQRFRAIENRAGVVRCTNTGITCAIDPLGRVVNQLAGPNGEDREFKGVLRTTVPYFDDPERTLYQKIGLGPWRVLSWLCAVFLLLAGPLGFVRWWKARRERRSASIEA